MSVLSLVFSFLAFFLSVTSIVLFSMFRSKIDEFLEVFRFMGVNKSGK